MENKAKEQLTTSVVRSTQSLPKDFEHNYNSPAETMTQANLLSSLDTEKVLTISQNPLFRKFWDKTMELYNKNPKMRYINPTDMTKSEQRLYANYIFTTTWKNLGFDYEDYKKNPTYLISAMICHGFLSMSAGTKVGVHFGLYTKTLLSLGTSKHEEYIRRAFDLTDYGCFMLTEMGHGSNVQGMLTTATYSHSDKSFILNTALDQGMKFWIGNLAETANMGVVFSNLIVNGRNEGVHGFLVKIRDLDGNLVPGITVGDCGMKMGNNGVDNGWAMFRGMKVGIDSLLNKFSQIDETGKFVSKIKSKTKRFAVQISALSGGRLGVAVSASAAVIAGCGIALRYCTVRRQFGESKGSENVLMDYALVSSQMITRMINGWVYKQASDLVDHEWYNVNVFDLGDVQVKELHALSSYLKVAASWNMKEGLLKAREHCGGHGYSAYSHLPVLLNDTEVHITWEGTNEVLLQQTCKNLLDEFNQFKMKGLITYKSLKCLADFEKDKVPLKIHFAGVDGFKKDLLTGELSKLLKVIHTRADLPDQKSLTKIGKALDKVISHLSTLMELRLYSMVDKCLSKFAQYLTQVKSTKNNFFMSFGKTLPNVLFPTASFFGELFCFRNMIYEISFLKGEEVSPLLFKRRPHFGLKNKNEYQNEILFVQKISIIFACATLSKSSLFLSEYEEDGASSSFFESLHEIVVKLSDNIRYDFLTIFNASYPDNIHFSSLADPKGDIYNQIKQWIWAREENFGKNPHWETIRQFRKANKPQ